MRAFVAAAILSFGALAAEAAEPVKERDLRQAMGYAQRGLATLQKGNIARAREDFERAISKFPSLPDAHAGFGHLAMRERRFDDALREYRLAEAGSREMASLRLQLESERFGRSRDELQRLRSIQMQLAQSANRSQMRGAGSGSAVGGSHSSQVQRQIFEIETRIRALEAMSLPTPDVSEEPPAELLFFQGNALFDLKQTSDAIVVWEAAARRMRDFGPVHNNLAVAYWMSGRLDEARSSVGRAEAVGFKVNPRFREDLEKAGRAAIDRAAVSASATP